MFEGVNENGIGLWIFEFFACYFFCSFAYGFEGFAFWVACTDFAYVTLGGIAGHFFVGDWLF